jgi:uncharacterized protein
MNLENELEAELELEEDAQLERIESLIRNGVNVNHLLEEHCTFLNLAVASNRLDIVVALTKAGAKINPAEIPLTDRYSRQFYSLHENRWTSCSLINAAHFGFQEIFDFLAPLTAPKLRRLATTELPEGIRCRAYSEEWRFDFTQAAAKNYLQNIQALIAARANINGIGLNNCTLLWTAAHNGHTESISTLVNAGADVNIKNQTDDWSPLMIAAGTHQAWSEGTRKAWGEDRSNQIEAVRLLIEAGSDIDATANDGQTPLMEAVQSGSLEMVEVLIQAGVDVNAKDNSGMSSLAYAQKAGFIEIAQRLQQEGSM